VSVPPLATCKRTGFCANKHIGSVASSSIGMLPAVSINASMLPPLISWGVNQSSFEPRVAPCTLALQSLVAVSTASKCWCFKPGWGRFCLMLFMCSGCLVMAAKAMDRRSIVPLPLFWLPSISIMLFSSKV
jgi:hypothetical protein